MAAIQLNFSLRTSSKCRTVHLIGSWDNYTGQLPLSKNVDKAGGWKGTFRFQGATLKQGQRYWYYYIIDGYHVSHDPGRDSVVEPTTGRKLNVLDIPNATKPAAPVESKAARHARRLSQVNVAKGRSLSPSKIVSPRPVKPHETQSIRGEAFNAATVEQLTAKFAHARVDDSSSDDDSDSDVGSDVPSLSSSRSSNSSTPSSIVSGASSCCTCERYGITRAGHRVKLDCGGSRCSYSEGSDCSSESETEFQARPTRRQGIVVRK